MRKCANYNTNCYRNNASMFEILAFWGCKYELRDIFGGDCTRDMDISNAGSTWVGLVAGIVIGTIITWWVYNRQKKTSEQQDDLLNHIADLEERNKTMLNKILSLEEKIETMLEKIK